MRARVHGGASRIELAERLRRRDELAREFARASFELARIADRLARFDAELAAGLADDDLISSERPLPGWTRRRHAEWCRRLAAEGVAGVYKAGHSWFVPRSVLEGAALRAMPPRSIAVAESTRSAQEEPSQGRAAANDSAPLAPAFSLADAVARRARAALGKR